MPKAIKECRVCGKKYEACRSLRNGSNVFNWREVACSPECGMIYLQRVTASRTKQDTSAVEEAGKADKPVAKVSKRKRAAHAPATGASSVKSDGEG